MTKAITKAWHFTNTSLRDGRAIPQDGEWLKHTGTVQVCNSGLHASTRLIDALNYAPGNTICRVSCRDIVATQNDKLVCRARRIDWRLDDAEELLRAFSRKVALSVIHLWDAPEIVCEYLETGNEDLRAALSRGTARYTARYIVRYAAQTKAQVKAWPELWSVAGDVARDAAITAFNNQLEEMVMAERRTHVRGIGI